MGRATWAMVMAALLVLSLVPAAVAAAPVEGATRHVELVVDTSGSMGGSRIAQAKQALTAVVGGLNANDAAALRSFSGSCSSGTRLLVDFGLDNRDELTTRIDALGTGGGTPTPAALRAAAADLAGVAPAVIVLVSDGQSTCGDPCPVAQQIVEESGTAFTAITVGFQATETAEEELRCIAEVTGGSYFAASDADELADAIGEGLQAARYVALGDSYSAGEGVGDYEEGTDVDSNACRRSAHAYPQIIAESTETPDALDFVACSGARTWHFYDTQYADGQGPQLEKAQILAADPDPDVELVTLTIGGNDLGFIDIILECAAGFELLPFNQCVRDEEKTEEPFQEAFSRLKGEEVDDDAAGDGRTRPLTEVYGDIRAGAPNARVLVLGYPQFYKDSGTLFLRCSGLKKADQLWVNEKVAELNAYIEQTAESFGFEFVDTTPYFDGHRLCELGGGEEREWFYDIQVTDITASYHPDEDGHLAMAGAALEVLQNDPPGTEVVMETGDVFSFDVLVDTITGVLALMASWPGSDVELTATSPSGVVHSRSDVQPGTSRTTAAVFDRLEVPAPEPGVWTVTMTGLDLDEGGEPVRLHTTQTPVPNVPPRAVATTSVLGRTVTLDGSGSSDPDGEIVSHTWFIDDTDGTQYELSGEQVTFDLAGYGTFGVTLRVEDDRGAAAYTGPVAGIPMLYDVVGPLPPVAPEPAVNLVTAAQAIPLRFATDLNGVRVVEDGAVTGASWITVDCDTGETVGGAVPQTIDAAVEIVDGRWQIDWETDRALARSCVRVRIDLVDGSAVTALFRFR